MCLPLGLVGTADELIGTDGTVIAGVLIPYLGPGDERPVAFSIPQVPTTATFAWALGSLDCSGDCSVEVLVSSGPTFARRTAPATDPSLRLENLAPGDYQFLCVVERAGFPAGSGWVTATLGEAGAALTCPITLF